MQKKIIPQTGFMRLTDILKVFPVGKTTWWTGVKDGRFPRPYKLSNRVTAWRVEDIRKLIDSCPMINQESINNNNQENE